MRKEPKFLSFSLPMLLFVGGCLLGAQSPLSAQVSEQMPTMPTDKTVITMTVEELHQYYPQAVRNLEFSFDQDQLAFLLAKIGERVQVFFGISLTLPRKNTF